MADDRNNINLYTNTLTLTKACAHQHAYARVRVHRSSHKRTRAHLQTQTRTHKRARKQVPYQFFQIPFSQPPGYVLASNRIFLECDPRRCRTSPLCSDSGFYPNICINHLQPLYMANVPDILQKHSFRHNNSDSMNLLYIYILYYLLVLCLALFCNLPLRLPFQKENVVL